MSNNASPGEGATEETDSSAVVLDVPGERRKVGPVSVELPEIGEGDEEEEADNEDDADDSGITESNDQKEGSESKDGEESPRVVERTLLNALAEDPEEDNEELVSDVLEYGKAAYKRHFHSILAKDTVSERRKQVQMTMFWGEGSAITGKKHKRIIDVFRNPETNKAEAKTIESAVPRLVDEQSVQESKFGTWDGVWVSCMLNIFGVIMYLRLGWVVGNAGIIGAIGIILLSGCVTLLTTLSMSAIATNGQVKGGGAYYLISRSVGPAVGGSIGILFTVGLCIAVSLYVIGFCDSVLETMGTEGNIGGVMMEVVAGFGEGTGNSVTGCYVNDIRLFGVILCTILIIMAVIGIGWVIKLQLFLMALIFATILSFLLGTFFVDEVSWREGLSLEETAEIVRPAAGFVGWGFTDEDGVPLIISNLLPQYAKKTGPDSKIDYSTAESFGSTLAGKFTSLGGALACAATDLVTNVTNITTAGYNNGTDDAEEYGEYTFFEVFAIFFPACTGIMAGANISGLLVNPQKNIPTGTLHAVLWSTLGYCLMAIFVGAVATREALQTNYFIMVGIELTPWLVWCGIFAATFSSALASIVGAPQLLLAIAKDDLMDCLAIFKTTHVRVGFKFFKAPVLAKEVNPNFSRKLRIYFVSEIFDGCESAAKLIHQVIDGTLEGAVENSNSSDEQRHERLLEAAAEHGVGRNQFGCTKLASTLTDLRLQIIDKFLQNALNDIDMLDNIKNFETSVMEKLRVLNEGKWNARQEQNGPKRKRRACCCIGCCEAEDPADPTGLGAVALADLSTIIQEVVAEESSHTLKAAIRKSGDAEDAESNLDAHITKLCEYVSGFDYDPRTPIAFGTVITEGDPMYAYVVSYILACACVCLGNLDIVAPLISMFFMMTYCLVNGAVFVQVLSRAPGWRPSFGAFNGFTAMLGAVLCFVAMLLIDEFWAVIALVIALIIYVVIASSDPPANWGSAPEAIESMRIMDLLLKMRHLQSHTKTFRPHILAVCTQQDKYSDSNKELMRFAYCLRKGFGITVLGVVQNDMNSQYAQDMIAMREKDEDTYFEMRPPRTGFGKNHGRADYRRFALIENVVAPDLQQGGRVLLTTSGIGKVRPNTLMLAFPRQWNTEVEEQKSKEIFRLMEDAFRMRFHVVLFRGKEKFNTCDFSAAPKAQGGVDVWWITDDGAMSLLTPHLMMQSSYWKNNTKPGTRITLRHVTALPLNAVAQQQREGVKMKSFLQKFRLNWNVEVEGLANPRTGETQASPQSILRYESLHPSMPRVADMSDEVKKWTHSWLRIGEVMGEAYEHNQPKCVYITLPFPRPSITPATYFGWLEMLSDLRGEDGQPLDIPVCFIRGNGKDVVTENLD